MIGQEYPPNRRQELLIQEEKKKGYWWQRKRQPVSPLTLEEQRVLKKVKGRAHYLDRGISCCCVQIGLDGLVGLIPVVGDFIGVLLALQLVYLATSSLDLPPEIIYKMLMNVAFDFLIGLIPLVGDVLDIMYKCNTKNAILLEDYLLDRHWKMNTPGPTVETIELEPAEKKKT
ncbi:hypothetical protein BY458DRAFT_525331 [Sporodiniella umbellata]|nr:hypothetical protein BY458DRAFT_525331 [Sporodiniella umbellata]